MKQNIMTGFTALLSGAALAQVIAFAAMPILTRVYSPEAFGLQGLMTSLLNLTIPLITLSLPLGIVVAKTENRAESAYSAVISVVFIMTLLLTATALLSKFSGLDIAVISQIGIALYLYPVAIIILGFRGALNNWVLRRKLFGIIAKAQVITIFSAVILKLLLSMVSPHGLALIVANIVGGAIGTIYIFGTLKGRKISPKYQILRLLYLRKILASNSDLILYRTPQNILNAATAAMPIIIIASFMGIEETGMIALALSALSLPANALGQATTQSLLPVYAEIVTQRERISNRILQHTTNVALIAAIPFAIMIYWGPDAFALFFGARWEKAGLYAAIISPLVFLQLVNKPAVTAATPLRLQKLLLIYEIIATPIKILALVATMYISSNVILAVTLYSILGTVAYLLLIYSIVIRARIFERSFKNG